MKILIYLVIATILGIALYVTIRGDFTKTNKLIMAALALMLFIIIGTYTAIQDNDNQKDMNLISSFMRGDVIKCGDIEIRNDKFNFTNPTLSFIGKKDTEFYGKVISIK